MVKKISIALFPLLSSFFLTTFQIESKSYADGHDYLWRYGQLEKYNRWYLSDLYHTIKPNIHHAYTILGEVSESFLQNMFDHHMHAQHTAQVRFAANDMLGQAEEQFLEQRLRNTHAGLESFLQQSVDQKKQPRIALCFSGGGIRALLLSLGFLIGAQDTGLLDCVTYMAGLSGSTWLMAPWIAGKKDLHQMRDYLGQILQHGICHLTQHGDRKCVLKQLLTKIWHRQFISAMDLYGPLLANTLMQDFDQKKLTLTLSDSHEHVVQGRYPLPIYTCIATNKDPYTWFEFTPFEVGSAQLGAYVPTWAYGRKFKNGTSINFAPEQSLAYCMGIFGSAFEVDIEDAIRLCADSIQSFKGDLPAAMHGVVDSVINNLVNSPLDDVRLAPSMLPNFVYKQDGHMFADQKTLSLVDAGIDFNLPFPPLLRAAREVDIIIVYDSSAGTVGEDLKKAALYAQSNGLKFPPVPDTIGENLCSILQDPHDTTCPIVVYMPRLKNNAYSPSFDPAICIENDYCNTFNFAYAQKEVEELTGLSEFACRQFSDLIKQVIKQRINI